MGTWGNGQGNGNGHGNGHGERHGARALVNMVLMCRSLLENNGLTEQDKGQARELLGDWMNLARHAEIVEGAEIGEDGNALFVRIESFVKAQAERRANGTRH